MADIKVSEVLCFITNRFCRMNRMELKTVLITFYKEDKLNDMKELLFANAGKLNVEGSLAM